MAWVKLHDDIIGDPKLLRAARLGATQLHWLPWLLAFAKLADDNGRLTIGGEPADPADIAPLLPGATTEQINSACGELLALGVLVVDDDGALRFAAWDQRAGHTSESPAAVNRRVRQHRQRKRSATAPPATTRNDACNDACNDSETTDVTERVTTRVTLTEEEGEGEKKERREERESARGGARHDAAHDDDGGYADRLLRMLDPVPGAAAVGRLWLADLPASARRDYSAVAAMALQDGLPAGRVVEAMQDWTTNRPQGSLGLWRQYLRKVQRIEQRERTAGPAVGADGHELTAAERFRRDALRSAGRTEQGVA